MNVRFNDRYNAPREGSVGDFVAMALYANQDVNGMLSRLIQVLAEKNALSIDDIERVVELGEVEEVK